MATENTAKKLLSNVQMKIMVLCVKYFQVAQNFTHIFRKRYTQKYDFHLTRLNLHFSCTLMHDAWAAGACYIGYGYIKVGLICDTGNYLCCLLLSSNVIFQFFFNYNCCHSCALSDHMHVVNIFARRTHSAKCGTAVVRLSVRLSVHL